MFLTVQDRPAFAYAGGSAFDAARPVVVLIHGAELDHSAWAAQADGLVRQGCTVLAPDLPGHGQSDCPPLTDIGAMADWTIALLDAAGVAEAALVGHSMGSLIALDCAGRHASRVHRLVLAATAFPMPVSETLLAAARDDEPAALAMINAWSHAARKPAPGSPAWAVAEANMRVMRRQPPGVLHVDLSACNNRDGLVRAAAVRCPTLFLLGGRDVMTPPRAARELAAAMAASPSIPNPHTVELPEIGHNVMGEAPEAVFQALRSFLGE
jgi:pimeloyl-ACP methyl ester carboxylesterase